MRLKNEHVVHIVQKSRCAISMFYFLIVDSQNITPTKPNEQAILNRNTAAQLIYANSSTDVRAAFNQGIRSNSKFKRKLIQQKAADFAKTISTTNVFYPI